MSKYLKPKALKSIRKWIKKIDHDEDAKTEKWPIIDLELPYKEIGAGRHRIVFDLGNGLVLKVAKGAKGIRCNKNEANLYHSVPSSLKKHLCKIIEYGHGWIIMKNIKDSMPKKKEYKKQVIQVLEQFCSYGVKISDIVDKKTGNVRRKNVRLNKAKQIVIIDYANVYDC